MATAGTVTVTVAGSDVYDDSKGCSTFLVHVLSGSANGALVNIPGLHDSGEFLPIPAGSEQLFRLNHLGIRKVTVKGDGGNANINFGVVAKTW
jgi:hypothetical protein